MSHPNRKKVVFVLGLIAFASAVLHTASLAQAQQSGGVDWIFVLDTSASMHGAGGARNIFNNVKASIADFIRSTREGDSVTLYTFDRDTTLRSNVRITGEMDKRDLLKTVDELQSRGDRTYTGKAIHDALERAAELKNRPDAANRTVSIVLFTDGLEDVRGIPNPISIPSNISLVPRDQPYMFFVSLGEHEHEAQLEGFVKDPALGGRGEVIRDPGAAGIAEVGDRIRKKIEAPPQPKEVKVGVEPSALDFGQVEPGGTTTQTLYARSDETLNVRLALDNSTNGEVSLAEPTEPVALKGGERVGVKVRLKVATTAADGPRAARLVLTPEVAAPNLAANPVSLDARLEVHHTPLWRKAIKWLLLFLLLAALIIVAVSLVKGEPPWVWATEVLPDKNLEGEIEVIQPRPPKPEDEFISLTQRQGDSVTLSSLVPDGATADADAELLTVRKDGRKVIRLHRTQGVLRVNKAEVASADLYDGDIIELGNARLRFNWVGHERPVEAEDEI